MALNDNWRASVLPYLPPPLIERLERYPHTAATWIEPVDGTLVFSDLSGFTEMSERLAQLGREGAEWLTEIINSYFQRMLDIARGYGGANLKFGGDALLLLFTGDAHASRAVASALAMQRATRQFPPMQAGDRTVRLRMSAGAHSGVFWSAAAGVSGQRMQHFILGPEASRVAEAEAVANAGELFVSMATVQRLRHARLGETRSEFRRVLRLADEAPEWDGIPDPTRNAELTDDLLAYLPPLIAEGLRTGIDSAGMESEHRKVTVLFIELLGLDEVLQEQGPERLLDELQQYVSCVVSLTERHGGFLASNDISTRGVKLIVVFGAPVAHEYDAANALRLALDLNREIPAAGLALRHRTGVNTGFVFAADVGSSFRREYTVMGDAVNLSARLMAAAEPGQILASRATAAGAGPSLVVEELPAIRVKGKSQPIPICSVLEERDVSASAPPGYEGALVGRDEEVDTIRRLCREAEGGEKRSLLVVGEAGIGKSHLVRECEGYVAVRGWKVSRGQCSSRSAGDPFAPWVQALNSLFDISPGAPAEERMERVMEALIGLPPEVQEIEALLNPLLNLSLPETDVVRSLDPEARRRRLFHLVAALLESAAAGSPVALVIEDFHWADPSSVQLLAHIDRSIDDSRLLLCLVQRPKDIGLQLDPKSGTTLVLGELPEEPASQLLRRALDRPDLPQAVARELLAQARGNPLFLEELARSMRQTGAIERLLDGRRRRGVETGLPIEVPDRVQGLIMSRLDALPQQTREVVRRAAVLGERFDLPALQALQQADPSFQVTEMVRLELVEPEAQEDSRAYHFRHALIQEVAYDSLSFARRRALHARAASYLETAHAERLEPHFGVLVHHWRRTGDKRKTAHYAVRAGDTARAVFANEEAIDYYQTALAATDAAEPEQLARVHESLGDVRQLMGEHQEAVTHFQSALAAALEREVNGHRRVPPARVLPRRLRAVAPSAPSPTRRLVSDICRKIGTTYERTSEYARALEWFGTGLSLLPTRSTSQRSRQCAGISGVLYRAGHYEEARRWCLRGLASARSDSDLPDVAHALDLLGVIDRDRGYVKRAVSHRLRALRLYQELGQLTGQADTLNNLGLDYFSLGEWPEAVRRFEESVQIASRIGDLDLIAMVHNNLGEVFLAQGELERARAEFRWTMNACMSLGHVALGALAQTNFGETVALQGRLDEGLEALEAALSAFRRVDAQGFIAEALARLGGVRLRQGDTSGSREAGVQALSTARQIDSRPAEGMALRLLGEVDVRTREWTAAEEKLLAARQIFHRSAARYAESKATSLLAEMFAGRYAESGRWEDRAKARALLRRCESTFESLGAAIDLQRARELLGVIR